MALFCVIDACAADLNRLSVQTPLGSLGASAWTLRQNYLVTVLAILGATYALYTWHRQLRLSEAAVGLARAFGVSVLPLTPWWVVSWRSSGTFQYPAVLGNGRADFGLTSDVSAREELEYFVLNALWNRPVRSIWLFVLAGISLARSPNNRSLHAFLLGTGAGVLALIHACRTWDDVASMGRYYLAFEGAFVLAALLKSAFDVSESGAPGNTRAKLGQLVSTADQVQMEYSTWARRIETQLWKPSAVDAEDGVYRRLQRAIPAGASFIEILDQPYRLDFQRNHILVCDQPGGASALRGLPIYGDVQLEQLENRHKTVFHEGQIRVLDSALPAPH